MVIDWLYKETKLVETPSIVRTLRRLLFQMQNFRFRSWAHEQIRQICFRFFEFYFPLSLRIRPLLSLFLPHFLFLWDFNIDGKRVWGSFKDHRIIQEGSLGGDWNKNPSNRWYVARIFQIWSAPASYGELAEPIF